MDHTDLSIVDLSQDWADLKEQLEALVDDLDRCGVLGAPLHRFPQTTIREPSDDPPDLRSAQGIAASPP